MVLVECSFANLLVILREMMSMLRRGVPSDALADAVADVVQSLIARTTDAGMVVMLCAGRGMMLTRSRRCSSASSRSSRIALSVVGSFVVGVAMEDLLDFVHCGGLCCNVSAEMMIVDEEGRRK